MAAILATTVAMEYVTRRWPAAEPRHGQCVPDQTGLHMRLHTPAYQLAAMQVYDASQVHQPSSVAR